MFFCCQVQFWWDFSDLNISWSRRIIFEWIWHSEKEVTFFLPLKNYFCIVRNSNIQVNQNIKKKVDCVGRIFVFVTGPLKSWLCPSYHYRLVIIQGIHLQLSEESSASGYMYARCKHINPVLTRSLSILISSVDVFNTKL